MLSSLWYGPSPDVIAAQNLEAIKSFNEDNLLTADRNGNLYVPGTLSWVSLTLVSQAISTTVVKVSDQWNTKAVELFKDLNLIDNDKVGVITANLISNRELIRGLDKISKCYQELYPTDKAGLDELQKACYTALEHYDLHKNRATTLLEKCNPLIDQGVKIDKSVAELTAEIAFANGAVR